MFILTVVKLDMLLNSYILYTSYHSLSSYNCLHCTAVDSVMIYFVWITANSEYAKERPPKSFKQNSFFIKYDIMIIQTPIYKRFPRAACFKIPTNVTTSNAMWEEHNLFATLNMINHHGRDNCFSLTRQWQ